MSGRLRLAVHGVSKHYGPVVALDDVTLDVEAGEIYALLGLNGAGKTTLIRILLGMVHPTSGRVELGHRPTGDRSVWADVGYLVETAAAYPELTVVENLEVVRRLRKLSSRTAVDEAVELFGLRPCADRRARELSLGNAQRLGLANRPALLLLDEPVNGLDPAGVVEVRTLLTHLAREHGTTVFLSSHILGEVSRLATRIGVLHQGRLIDELATAELASRVNRYLEIGAADQYAAARLLGDMGLEVRQLAGTLQVFDANAVQHPDSVATALVQGGAAPTRLAVVEEDLERYFLRLVGVADVPTERPEVMLDAR